MSFSLYEIKEMIHETGLFHERSRGRFYLNDRIRFYIFERRLGGVTAKWEVYRIGEKKKYIYPRTVTVKKEDWFSSSPEEVFEKYIDKELKKKLIFEFDIFLKLK